MVPKVQEYKLRIIKIIYEAPEVKTFKVEVPDDVNINFNSGQFFMVRFKGNKTLHRAYSIASSPTEKNHMDITMNLVGEFTSKLFKSKVGDHLIFKGPYGKFYFTEDMSNNLILIGGGLGIVPLMSIIKYCNFKKLSNKINLIYSVRTPEDIVYREKLEYIKKENPNFDYMVTITRPRQGSKWKGKTGRVDEKLLRENIDDIENSLYFLCGPLQFVKSNIAILESLGAKKEQIKTDVWGE